MTPTSEANCSRTPNLRFDIALDHHEQIEREMKESEGFVAGLERAQGPTRYTRLRDQLLR